MLSANEQAHKYRRTRWLQGLGFAFLTASFAAGSSICSEILDDHNKSIYFALLCCYVTLIFVYGPIRATEVISREHSFASSNGEEIEEAVMDKKVRTNTFLKRYRICFENVRDQLMFTPNRKSFLLIAMTVLDFSGNYMQLLTFYYTSVSSGSIFLSATVPFSMLLGRTFLSHSYRKLHVVGSCIACGGLLFMIAFDLYDAKYLDSGKHDEINPVLGDFFGLLAALFQSLSDVMQEYLVTTFGVCENEILTAFGVYGVITSVISLLIQYGCSYVDLIQFFKSIKGVYEWAIYGSLAICEFGLHLNAFHALSRIDAGTFNVAMLGQPLMVGIVRLCGFDGGFKMMQAVFFFMTLLVQTSGIALFSYAGDVKEDEDEKKTQSLILGSADGQNQEEKPLLMSKNN
jgi:drug/metabolite transporter (DMT)-like permease